MSATLRAVRDSDGDRETVRRLELVPAGPQPEGTERREAAEFVRRRRVSPRWRRTYTAVLVLGDLTLAVAAFGAGLTVPGQDGAAWLVLSFAAAFVICLTLARVYEHRFLGSGSEEFRRLAGAATVLLAVTATAGYASDADLRGLVLVGCPLAAVLALLWHATARQVLFAMRRRGLCARRVVVIGLERSVDELVRRIGREPHGGVKVVAACLTQAQQGTVAGVPIAGTPDQAASVARRYYADTILLTAWSQMSEDELRHLSWRLEGTGYQLLVAPRLTEVAPPRIHLQTIGGVPLLFVDEPEFTGLRRVAKAVIDYLLAITALILLAPVLLAVAIAVRCSSSGPVFFRQVRIGRDSEPFRMTKFRSMYVDAEQRKAELAQHGEAGRGPMFKMRNDPRVTPVGAFLRRYSLDELPQLFDVLRRSMSVVGPRPPLASEVAAYEKDVHRRLLVRPGITGLWQVSGRSDLTWDETVRLDLSYVENWSLGLDLSIIARTVVAVLARRGAY